ncbi:hypothetical protein EK21DRAFT_119643 [Setomelanomma holmii]|uniref:Uncharacterized protein n=1 Tax=Setomelanomma holmii TaxID=210430 RepID=A0A9P4LEW5_9PLEO|nr:hypothetical protein EK21DRAFT_119643 [Setomelanomma holmii]
MATSPLSCQTDLFLDPSQPYDTYSDIQSEGAGRTAAPGTPRESHPHTDGLGFLPLDEWDEHNSYDEDVPSRLRYTVEWKVMVNNKVIAKETEQDVVLAPAAYWHMYLNAKVERLVSRKLPPHRNVEYDDTNVVVSVNDRSERDVTKQFDSMDIDWSAIARQLVRWGELLRVGKKLRVDLSFNYSRTVVEDLLYYKLRTHHLKALIELVQQGLVLSTHNDVPEEIRDQLYAEDHQRRERPASGSSISTPSLPPITINNVMPSPSPFQDSPLLRSSSASSASHERLADSASLDISGPRDLAVMAYSDWQQSNVVDEAQKNEYQKACDLVLREMLDLEQVYEDQNPAFFIQGGVKSGVARRFVSDIARWARDHKTT